MPTTLPITDPVLIFALAMGIFLLAPVIFERLRIPGLIGLIVFGAIVGPNVLNLLARDFTFELLGQVGLLYLVFLAGLELDLNRFNEYRSRSITFGLLSFGIPMALAVGVMPLLGFSLQASVLIGAIIGSHTLLAYPVASRLGIVKNPAVITVIGGTLVTDTLALTVLAVVAGSMSGTLDATFWLRLFGVLALYAVIVVVAVPRIGRWFFRNVPSQAPAEFIFLMVVLFAVAWSAKLAGAEPIIGAFLAGLTLNRLIPLNSPLMTRVRFVGNALFIPFFLLSVGMLVDPRVLVESADVWIIAGALTGLVLVGKFAGAWVSKMLFRYNREEGLTMFGLSSPQAAATLAVTFVGLEIGLFGEAVVNAVIIMIVVTVFVGPSLVERFGRELALQEERRPYDPSEAPRRILIPISNPATADALMDISFLLRGKDSDEPLYPLMVVRGSEQGSEAQVAEAEKMLSHAVLYAAGADVPVAPLTRVDQNIASGVSRAMAETRTSIVVVGWDGRTSGSRTAVFGTVLDQLLDQTRQTVIVAKMGHPLNTTGRIVLVVPPSSDRQPGFTAAASLMKRLASEVDARLEAIVVGEDVERYRETLVSLRPEHPTDVSSVEGWGPLLWELRTRLDPQDLVVVLSARSGTVGWTRELEKLPGQLTSLVPESFLMVYPSEVDAAAAAAEGGELPAPVKLPSTLDPSRVVLDASGATYREVLRNILSTHFHPGAELAGVLDRLANSEEEFSSEIRPGVALPHALIGDLEDPIMFLGLVPSGIRFPNTETPAQAVFVLLGASEKRFDHLRLLTRTARLLRSAGEVESLIEATDMEQVKAWFAKNAAEALPPRSRDSKKELQRRK
jgi:Kef-type K+ transport system membrane component KefB/mannitol/fructose-specific phosphotransferase system IIA component (Ntr-type)/nucleotide-binding universal stress UspA family protein